MTDLYMCINQIARNKEFVNIYFSYNHHPKFSYSLTTVFSYQPHPKFYLYYPFRSFRSFHL